MNDWPERLLNPGILTVITTTGIAYGGLLWAIDLRPAIRLAVAAILPGAMFILVIWISRAVQGVVSSAWPFLLLDWLLFSTVGVLTVLVGRRWKSRP